MQIIPVLDIARGRAVRAQAGDRSRYQPVESVLAPHTRGDAVALLRGYRRILGATTCYIADLDAIQGGVVQRSLLGELAQIETGFSGPLLIDAGSSGPGGAIEVLSCGASEVVIGLESLQAFADLAAIVQQVGPTRVVFSLDLRLGTPIMHPALQDATAYPEPLDLAQEAVDAGVRTVLVLDVGRVGTGCGIELGLLEALRRRFPDIRLLSGGGVLARKDLERMRDAGCDGALLASALHTGRITARDLADLTRDGARRA